MKFIQKLKFVKPFILFCVIAKLYNSMVEHKRRYFKESFSCFCSYIKSQWGSKQHWTQLTFIVWIRDMPVSNFHAVINC